MRLVLLGDLHFYQLGVWPWQLFSKRLLGQINLWFDRRRHFRPELWTGLGQRVHSLAPDGLICSGDFTTTALSGEFRQARQAWSALADGLSLPAGAHVVPGNHDRYCYGSKRRQLFEKSFEKWTSRTWPMHRALSEDVHLIGLDPTRPNVFNASGALGGHQLRELHRLLHAMAPGAAVLVLCHYPIGTPEYLPAEAPGHGLQDGDALVKCLAQSGRELTYLHGHIHWPWVWKPPAAPNVTTVNAGAPMLTGRLYPNGQGFAELTVEDSQTQVTRHWMKGDGAWTSQREYPGR